MIAVTVTMDEGSVVLDTFQSEIVTDDTDDEEEDDNGDIRDPLLTSSDDLRGGRRKIFKDEPDRVRTRLVYNNKLQLHKSSRCCCSLLSWKSILCFLLILIVLGILAFFVTQNEALLEEDEVHLTPNMDYMDFKQPENMVTYHDILEDNFTFNVSSKTDVMVFLHIQKTGGTTFGRHLVEDIDLARPCECHRKNKKRRRKFHCDCFRPGTEDSNWLFSRY